jgi:hypothetical protein
VQKCADLLEAEIGLASRQDLADLNSFQSNDRRRTVVDREGCFVARPEVSRPLGSCRDRSPVRSRSRRLAASFDRDRQRT